jgi:hypothetical protein
LGWFLARSGSTVKISRPVCEGIGTAEPLPGKAFQCGRAACGLVSPVWTALSRSARLPESAVGEAAPDGGAAFLHPIDRMADAVKTAKRTWLFMPPKYNPLGSRTKSRILNSYAESWRAMLSGRPAQASENGRGFAMICGNKLKVHSPGHG